MNIKCCGNFFHSVSQALLDTMKLDFTVNGFIIINLKGKKSLMKPENVSLEFLFYIKVKAAFSLVSTLSPTFILMLEVSCQSARRGHMHIFILLLHSLSFPCLSQSPDSSRTSHIQLSGFAGFVFFFHAA